MAMSEYVRTGTSLALEASFTSRLCASAWLHVLFFFASMGTKRKTSQDSKPCFEKHISRVYLPIWNETWARPALRTLSRRSSKTFLAASLASAKRSKHVKALKALVLWTRSVTHSVTCHDAPPSHRPPPSGHQPPSTRKDTKPHDQRI